MEIEQFVSQSEGEWKSMRSGHSLAFQQFEEVISTVKIKALSLNEPEVIEILSKSPKNQYEPVSPFRINWEAESDWMTEDASNLSVGSCLLIPMPISFNKGIMLRSRGYAESIETYSKYSFLEDETFLLQSKYETTIAEERIWFLAENVRCRSTVIKNAAFNSILQTSFASEVRRLKP